MRENGWICVWLSGNHLATVKVGHGFLPFTLRQNQQRVCLKCEVLDPLTEILIQAIWEGFRTAFLTNSTGRPHFLFFFFNIFIGV